VNDRERAEIERYLDGGMSAAEAASFLESLRRDPEALAWLGRVLEQQALLYDAVQGRSAGVRRDTAAPLIHARRPPKIRAYTAGSPFPWIAGLLAASFLVASIVFRFSPRTPPSRAPAARTPVASGAPPGGTAGEAVPPPSTGVPPGQAPPESGTPDRRGLPSGPPTQPPADGPENVPAPPRPPFPLPPAAGGPGPSRTFPAVARLETVKGLVTLLDGTELRADHLLREGQGIRTGGTRATAVLRFPDGSRLELGPETRVSEIRLAEGRRIFLEEGTLCAEIARPSPGMSTAFVTPHGEAVVLGTFLRLVVDREGTRLEVTEGKVSLRRRSDGASTDVDAGHYAVVRPGEAPVARPLPIDEILLGSRQAVLFGPEWRLVRDPDALGGLALENRTTANRLLPGGINADASRAVFSFRADAERTYFVWVRGRTLGPRDVLGHDAVLLEWSDALVRETPGPNQGKGGHPARSLFNGFVHREGYWWVGGDADGGADATSPVTVRFSRPGRQILAIYGCEPPVRLDAILISTRQNSRPESLPPGIR